MVMEELTVGAVIYVVVICANHFTDNEFVQLMMQK